MMIINRYQFAILVPFGITVGGYCYSVWDDDYFRMAISVVGLVASAALFFLATDKSIPAEKLSETPERDAANDDHVAPEKPKRRSLAQCINHFLYGADPTETLIDLSQPDTEKKVLAGKIKIEPGQVVMLGKGKFGAFIDLADHQIRVVPADSKEQAALRYQRMLEDVERVQTPPAIEQPEPEQTTYQPPPTQLSTPIQPEWDETLLDGYKPEKWMLKERAKIDRFIQRELSGMPTKGAIPKPWDIGEAYASLNDVTVMINTHGNNDRLLKGSFRDYLLQKLPEGSRIEKPGHGRKFPAIIFPRRKREFIMTDQAINDYYAAQIKSDTAAMIGLNETMQVVALDFSETPHVVIPGDTGSGKGVCSHNLLTSLMAKNPPDQIQFVRIDPKGNELSIYDGLPHMIGDSLTDIHAIADMMEWVENETKRRYELLKAEQAKNITAYNSKKTSADQLPRIIVIFDELKVFVDRANRIDKDIASRVADHISECYAIARAAGVHIVLITQTGVDNKKINQTLQSITTKIIFKCEAYTLQGMVQGKVDLSAVDSLKGCGHGLFYSGGKTIEFQAPSTEIELNGKIIAECLKKVIAALKKKWKDYNESELISVQPEIEIEPEMELNLSRHDELYLNAIRFIAEQNKVIRDDINHQFGIGTPKTTKLLNAMADDGLISHPDGSRRPREVLPKIYAIAKKISVNAVVKEQSTPVEEAVNVFRFDRSKTA